MPLEEPLNKDRVVFVVKVLAIVVSLYLFLVGIAGIGHSFQLFGGEFSEGVLTATESPVVALFIGILATSLAQSSSTTSSVIVGLVAGGTIPTEAAVFMIMGANVGTTVTNTIVSLGHIAQGAEFRRAFAAATVHDFFNLMAVAILFPLEWATGFLSYASVFLATAFAGLGGLQVGSPVKAATGPAVSALATAVGQQGTLLLVIAAALTVGALFSIVRLLRSLALRRVEAALDERLFRNAGRSMLVGVAITMVVHHHGGPEQFNLHVLSRADGRHGDSESASGLPLHVGSQRGHDLHREPGGTFHRKRGRRYGVAGAPAVQRLRNCPGVAGFASSRPADLPGGEDGRRDDAQPSGPAHLHGSGFLRAAVPGNTGVPVKPDGV